MASPRSTSEPVCLPRLGRLEPKQAAAADGNPGRADASFVGGRLGPPSTQYRPDRAAHLTRASSWAASAPHPTLLPRACRVPPPRRRCRDRAGNEYARAWYSVAYYHTQPRARGRLESPQNGSTTTRRLSPCGPSRGSLRCDAMIRTGSGSAPCRAHA